MSLARSKGVVLEIQAYYVLTEELTTLRNAFDYRDRIGQPRGPSTLDRLAGRPECMN